MYARNQHANPTINETMGRDAPWRSSCCCYWPPSTKLASTIVISSYQMMGWLVGWLVSQHGFPSSPNSRVHSQAAVEDSWMFHDFLPRFSIKTSTYKACRQSAGSVPGEKNRLMVGAPNLGVGLYVTWLYTS